MGATGAQAAAYAKQFLGTATSVDKCVYGIVYAVLNPLGVPAPQTEYIPTLLSSPLIKKISKPVPGCIARWPQALGYQHVSIITDILGNGEKVTEQSWGTSNGKVRAFNYDTSFFESFWLPAYDDSGTSNPTVSLASQTSGTVQDTSFLSGASDFLKAVQSPAFWTRVGVGAIGASLLLLAIVKLLGGPAGIASKTAKVAGTVAMVAPK